MVAEILVLTTCTDADSKKIARALVEERLAACVNILPQVTSVFHWQGKLCEESEQLLIIKTKQALWEKLQGRLQQLHSYDVPEILSLSINSGSREYLKWLHASLG